MEPELVVSISVLRRLNRVLEFWIWNVLSNLKKSNAQLHFFPHNIRILSY